MSILCYCKLTGTRFNNYISPKYYYPSLTVEDYKVANFSRYFVQRKNNLLEIIEIDKLSFKNINNNNEIGIDSGQYNKVKIQWSIVGTESDVKNANQRVILNSNMLKLDTYLTDPVEFYK